jgi:hypothetical protein
MVLVITAQYNSGSEQASYRWINTGRKGLGHTLNLFSIPKVLTWHQVSYRHNHESAVVDWFTGMAFRCLFHWKISGQLWAKFS